LTTNPHAYVTSSSGERFTPKYIVEAARATLGNIDLDPASCARANEIVQADTFFCRGDDGLNENWSWCGHVFLNPPGNCRSAQGVLVDCGNDKTCSCKLVRWYWDRLLGCSPEQVPAAIWIGFHLDQLQSLQTPLCFPTCILSKRIQYLDSDFNVMPSPPHGSYVTLVTQKKSEYVDRFIENFGLLGMIVGPIQ
jgi:hypothetical protein